MLEKYGIEAVVCSPFYYRKGLKILYPFSLASCAGATRFAETLKSAECVPVKRKGEDAAVYIHSGGTTGTSKAVVISNRALNSLAESVVDSVHPGRMDIPENGGMLAILPVFHGFGLGICVHTVICHIRVVLMPLFRAKEAARLIKKYSVTHIAGVPQMYSKLTAERAFAGEGLKQIECVFCGGDKLYVLGDVIDKGPDSIRLAKLLFSLPNVQCIAGNHEYDFVKFYKKRMMEVSNNYEEVLFQMQGYFSDGKLLDWETLDNFEYLPFYIEDEDFIGVHAGALLKGGSVCSLTNTPNEIFVYDRTFKDSDVLPKDSKCVLFGHTPIRNLTGRDEILLYRRNGLLGGSTYIKDYAKIHIDTGVYLSGTLCSLRNSWLRRSITVR